jgi:flagellin
MIMNGINNEFDTLNAGIQNSNEFTGMMRIADNSLQNITKQTDELSAISVRYNNDSLSNSDRSMLRRESQHIIESMNQTISNTTYNGQRIMNGSEMSVFDGSSLIRVNIGEPNTSTLDITNPDSMKDFSKSIHRTLSDIGSTQNQLESSLNVNTDKMLNSAKMYDSAFNLGEEVMKLERDKLLTQSSQFAQSMSTEVLQKQILGVLQ